MEKLTPLYLLDGRQLAAQDLNETRQRMQRLGYNVRPALPGEIKKGRKPQPFFRIQNR